MFVKQIKPTMGLTVPDSTNYDCDYHIISQRNLTYMIWKHIFNLNINTILLINHIVCTQLITNDRSCLLHVP